MSKTLYRGNQTKSLGGSVLKDLSEEQIQEHLKMAKTKRKAKMRKKDD